MRRSSSDSLLMALQVPLRKPARTALTTLGLAIGVGAFIAMVSFGRGARSSIVSQFETLGSNVLRIRPQYGRSETPPRPLSHEDVRALTREATTLAHVIPYAATTLDVTYRDRQIRMAVSGTVPEYIETRGWKFGAGGIFNQNDANRRAKVCVLGAATAATLFDSSEPLGQPITLAGTMPCYVIGVLAPLGVSMSGSDLDGAVLMPLATFETQIGEGLSLIEARPMDRSLLELAKQEVSQILRRTHEIDREQPDDFTISSPDDVTFAAEQVGGILTGLLAGIAAVSLLVGGIGIMNIQLVSVAERTHEIGIRSALGASPQQIERQFLAEAAVLAALGSAFGVGLGLLISFLVSRQMHWPNATTADIVLGSAAFGIAVGTLFGYLPAKRAAKLDPVEALRRE
jgi:putative ABC transport system permease protein